AREARIFSGERVENLEVIERHSDGTELNILLNAFPLFDPSGQVVGAISARLDITDRKRHEHQIADQLDQIKRYSAEIDCHRRGLEESNAKLAALAVTDGLTELNNHRAFQERLEQEFVEARRYGTPLSLLLLDVD